MSYKGLGYFTFFIWVNPQALVCVNQRFKDGSSRPSLLGKLFANIRANVSFNHREVVENEGGRTEIGGSSPIAIRPRRGEK